MSERKATPVPAAAELRRTPLTALLLTLNLLVFAVTAWLGGAGGLEGAVRFGACERSRVAAGELHRLVAVLFLHADVLHLLVNSYLLFVWGTALEKTLGSLRLGLLYFLGGVGTSLVGLQLHDATAVGGSGALFALLGAALVRSAGSGLKVALSVGFLLIGGLKMPGLDTAAHAAGLGLGILLALALPVEPRRPRLLRAGRLALAAGAAMAAFGILASLPQKPAAYPGVQAMREAERRCRAGDFAGALERADRARALGCDSWEVAAERARALSALGRHDEALVELDEAVRRSRPAARLFHERALVREALGRSRGALEDYDRSLSLEPGRPCCHLGRGRVRLALGNPADARADVERAFVLAPRNDSVRARAQDLMMRLQ